MPPQIHLGCQTITWDQERSTRRDHTVAEVAAAGYEGLEIGARFLNMDDPAEFKAVLDQHGVQLAALHTGWNFDDPSKADSDRDEMAAIINFAVGCGTKCIVMSGANDAKRLLAGAAQLNAIGRQCADQGVTFCYHNHYWEIENDAQLLRALDSATDPALVSYCPDLGWVRKTTANMEPVLELMAPRTRLVHLKDYVSDDLSVKDDETEFGKGIVDFTIVRDFVNGLDVADVWVLAEQWKSAEGLSPEESIRANFKFLTKLFA